MSLETEVTDGLRGYEELSFGSGYREELGVNRALAALMFYASERPHFPVRRVCDIACGTGRQVLVGALLHPQTQFLGIDGSKSHIAEAKRFGTALGLPNVRFECVDLRDAVVYPEKFDLITCAGAFSWVPVDVQAEIFQFIATNLSAQGAAIIHYLTLPGATVEQRLQRDIAQQVKHIPTLQARLKAAQAYLSAQIPGVATLAADEASDVRTRVARRLFKAKDRGVPHEFLASPISAYYFRDFTAQASAHGLHVLGDASVCGGEATCLPAGAIQAMFAHAKSWEEQQELLDMFGGRSGGRYALLSRSPRAEAPYINSLKGTVLRLSESDWYEIDDQRVHLSETQSLPISQSLRAGLTKLHTVFPAALSCLEAFPGVHEAALWPLVDLGVITVLSSNVTLTTRPPGTLRAFDIARVEGELGHDDLTSFIGISRPRHTLVGSILSYAAQPQTREALVEHARNAIGSARAEDFESDSWRRWWPQKDALGRKFAARGVSEALPEALIDRLVRLGYLA